MKRYGLMLSLLFISGLLAGCIDDLDHAHEDGTKHTHEDGNMEHNHIVIEEEIYFDDTPRISYWTGKVNNHYANGTWISDPDDTSGSDIEMLEYCKKWWPDSVDVSLRTDKESISFKKSGESTEYAEERAVYECVRESQNVNPRITYWPGMINQHNMNGTWISDPDEMSGANIDMLEYCKKWWPETISVKLQRHSELIEFKQQGNNATNNHSSEVYLCIGIKDNAKSSDYSNSLLRTTSTVIVQISTSEVIIITSFIWILFTLFMVAGKFEYRNYQANKMIDKVVFEEEE